MKHDQFYFGQIFYLREDNLGLNCKKNIAFRISYKIVALFTENYPPVRLKKILKWKWFGVWMSVTCSRHLSQKQFVFPRTNWIQNNIIFQIFCTWQGKTRHALNIKLTKTLSTSSLIWPSYTIRATIFEKMFPPTKFPKT